MKIRKIIALLAASTILLSGSYAYAGLRDLMELGNNQARIAKALKKETKNYKKVKKAITSGKLKEGMKAGKIRKKYGKPIFDNVYDKKKNAYKWLYMPAGSTHFEGEKLYLFVSENGQLVGWQMLEQPEGQID